MITLASRVVVFAGTIGPGTLLKTDFLGSFADQTTPAVDQELPAGTRLSTTSEAAKKVEAVAGRRSRGEEYLTTIGAARQRPAPVANVVELTVQLARARAPTP